MMFTFMCRRVVGVLTPSDPSSGDLTARENSGMFWKRDGDAHKMDSGSPKFWSPAPILRGKMLPELKVSHEISEIKCERKQKEEWGDILEFSIMKSSSFPVYSVDLRSHLDPRSYHAPERVWRSPGYIYPLPDPPLPVPLKEIGLESGCAQARTTNI